MKKITNQAPQSKQKKRYTAPQIERIALDTEISLVMMSGPPPNPSMPQLPEGYIQKIFKFGW